MRVGEQRSARPRPRRRASGRPACAPSRPGAPPAASPSTPPGSLEREGGRSPAGSASSCAESAPETSGCRPRRSTRPSSTSAGSPPSGPSGRVARGAQALADERARLGVRRELVRGRAGRPPSAGRTSPETRASWRRASGCPAPPPCPPRARAPSPPGSCMELSEFTPRTLATLARVTGWEYATMASVSMAACESFARVPREHVALDEFVVGRVRGQPPAAGYLAQLDAAVLAPPAARANPPAPAQPRPAPPPACRRARWCPPARRSRTAWPPARPSTDAPANPQTWTTAFRLLARPPDGAHPGASSVPSRRGPAATAVAVAGPAPRAAAAHPRARSRVAPPT